MIFPSADDTDTFHLLRLRLNLDANISDTLRAFLQLQDSRIFDSLSANRCSTTFRDELDIRQAYIDIKNIFKGATLRAGRQELSYGEQRLLGGFDWSNVTQSFDAVKLIYAQEKFSVDGFLSTRSLLTGPIPTICMTITKVFTVFTLPIKV